MVSVKEQTHSLGLITLEFVWKLNCGKTIKYCIASYKWLKTLRLLLLIYFKFANKCLSGQASDF